MQSFTPFMLILFTAQSLISMPDSSLGQQTFVVLWREGSVYIAKHILDKNPSITRRELLTDYGSFFPSKMRLSLLDNLYRDIVMIRFLKAIDLIKRKQDDETHNGIENIAQVLLYTNTIQQFIFCPVHIVNIEKNFNVDAQSPFWKSEKHLKYLYPFWQLCKAKLSNHPEYQDWKIAFSKIGARICFCLMRKSDEHYILLYNEKPSLYVLLKNSAFFHQSIAKSSEIPQQSFIYTTQAQKKSLVEDLETAQATFFSNQNQALNALFDLILNHPNVDSAISLLTN